jgi:hypothetical protein
MVAHQAPGMNLPFGLRTSLTERLEKQLAIFVTTEDRLPMVAAAHHVVNSPGVLDPKFSCDGNQLAAAVRLSQ